MASNDECFVSILDRCLTDETSHARLLHLFATLESLGSQKIHRFLRWTVGHTNQDQLDHAAEEARHAAFFAKKAHYLAREKVSVSIHDGKHYFRQIEVRVLRVLSNLDISHIHLSKSQYRYLAYLLTTIVIELRAQHVYQKYEQQIAKYSNEFSLKHILREEAGHLAQMQKDLKAFALDFDVQGTLNILLIQEQKLFNALIQRIKRSDYI